jgi:hypothetical protein
VDEATFGARFADLLFCTHTFDGEEQVDLLPQPGAELPMPV